MRFLIIPSNNSLSHVIKALAIQESLLKKGHEVLVAVGKRHFVFAEKYGPCVTVSDIQEADDGPIPTFEWFKNPSETVRCIQDEVRLIRDYNPDRILGVFRFTAKIAAGIAGKAFDSLTCGCMTSDSGDVLGISDSSPNADVQREYMRVFYYYATQKTNIALRELGFPEIDDVRDLLKGERTFLWDFPEFMPLQAKNDLIYVGPISWDRLPYDDFDMANFLNPEKKLAVISFGTCTRNISVLERISSMLLSLNFSVLFARGGHAEAINISRNDDFMSLNMAPMNKILRHATLLVSHGGQMTLFEALQNRVPSVIMPFQPEQAHNGLCLERLGCGTRIVRDIPFIGNPNVYADNFKKRSSEDIKSEICSLLNNRDLYQNLTKISEAMKKYNGVEALSSYLES